MEIRSGIASKKQFPHALIGMVSQQQTTASLSSADTICKRGNTPGSLLAETIGCVKPNPPSAPIASLSSARMTLHGNIILHALINRIHRLFKTDLIHAQWWNSFQKHQARAVAPLATLVLVELMYLRQPDDEVKIWTGRRSTSRRWSPRSQPFSVIMKCYHWGKYMLICGVPKDVRCQARACSLVPVSRSQD